MVPNSELTFVINAIEANETATPKITSVQFPMGISTTATFPLAIPTGGASLTLQTSALVAAGTYTVVLNGQAGTATASLNLPITIQTTNLPTFSFSSAQWWEVAIPDGGSGQVQFMSSTNSSAEYNVALSASGQPPGTTVTFSPSVLPAGSTLTATVTASGNAPYSQNAEITVTGTPEAPVQPASVTFLASVSPPQNAAPNNRTDYLSTEASPYAAVFDPVHGLIFSSNAAWNRVDVTSDTTHAIVASVPIADPRGIDISMDSSTVWVATDTQQVFAINTTTFAPAAYQLPGLGTPSSNGIQDWQAGLIFALSDGTLMIASSADATLGNSFANFVIWNPTTNALTPLKLSGSVSPGILERTGDGTKVYSISADSSGQSFYYDVATQQFSSPLVLGGLANCAAVNYDGSRVAVYDYAGLNMYDGNLNLLGPLPGGGLLGGLPFEGGMVFSATTGDLYETSVPSDLPFIITIDPNTLQPLTIAPAMGIPAGDNMPPLYIPTPFAIDSTGMVLGLQPYGVSFDDSTFGQNFSPMQPGFPNYVNHMSPYVGPLSGGTMSGGFGNAFNITPAVWYGQIQGVAINTNHDLEITSPATTVPGPVNVKFIFPDGTEVFDPLFFSYGPLLQHAVLSGAPPEGGVPGEVSGFGLPSGSGGGTLTVGGAAATIKNPPSTNAPYTGAPFPTSSIISFSIPPGSPGYADVALTTPNGKSTLPKAMFYAQSVQDYSSADVFTAVLYDSTRQQLYLSAGNHIDVFSLASNTFVSPLTPPALGSTKEFVGLALTPDGSLLLAADLLDGSLAVLDPDNPTNSYAVSVTAVTGSGSCYQGPMYVQAVSDSLAFVELGGLPAPACGSGGTVFQLNLTARTSQPVNPGTACASGGGSIGSSSDGTYFVYGGSGFCVYNTQTQTFSGDEYAAQTSGSGASISGDGNVAASQWVFLNLTPLPIGSVARPDVYYEPYSEVAGSEFFLLLQPKLNDSGSLYYLPYPEFFDIVDVQHEALRMRFSLAEQISNTATPLAIDSGGRHIYLLTDKGLTIVDLGEAPLSIGHLTPTTASPGTQVTVRGSGFASTTTATVGGQSASVTFTDENTLTLTVPSAPSGLANIVLTNSDGTSYTLQSAITIN